MQIPQVQIPDFAGTLQRVEQAQASRLQQLAMMQAYEDANLYRDAAQAIIPQLGTAEGPQRSTLIAKLAAAGPQGAQVALPMLRQEREQAEFARMLGGIMPGGGAPAAPAPAVGAPAMPTMPAAPAGAAPRPVNTPAPNVSILPPAFVQQLEASRGNPEALARTAATLRGLIPPDAPNRVEQIQTINDYVMAVAGPRGGSTSRTTSTTVPAMPGWDDGIPAPGARPAAAAPPAAPGVAPAGANGLPSPQALFAMAASGNPRAVEFVRTVAPLVARENPNFSFQNIGGRMVAINPQNPQQRIDLGVAGDGPSPERIRQPDGSVRIVARPDAIGQTEAPAQPDNFGRANTLRDEFTRLTGDFRIVQNAWENMQANARSQNGQGDMSMLYQFIKLLDPTSVVRESEFAMAAQTGAIDERVAGWVQRIMSGERLPDSVRQSFLAEARSLYGNQRRVYDQTSEVYRDLASRNGLDPANVVVPFALRQPAAPPAPPGPPPPDPNAPRPPPPSPVEQQRLLRDARDAVRQGAPIDAVRQRLQERGIDPGLLR
jgi:hypothetical protein